MAVKLEVENIPLIDKTAREELAKVPLKIETTDDNTQDIARSIIHQASRDGKKTELFDKAIREHPEAVNIPDRADGMTSLHFAAKYGNVDIINVLLSNGADVTVTNYDGDTPLHLVAKYCKRGDSQDPNNATAVIIHLLVQNKADINAKDKYELTSLHYAAMKSNLAAIVKLIAVGANVKVQDSNEVTPLLLGCIHGTKEVIEKLLNAGSNISKEDQRHNTVFHIVALRGEPEILRMLLERGGKKSRASLEQSNNEGKTPLRLAVEGNHPETLKEILNIEKLHGNEWQRREEGLLHFAAGRGYLEVLVALVQAGGNKRERDSNRRIPLHDAARLNQKETVEYLLEESTMEVTDDFGMTPLMFATAHNSIDALRVLVERKANIFAKDNEDRTAVFIGAKFNALKTIEYLLIHWRELQKLAKETANARTKFFRTLRNIEFSDEQNMTNQTDGSQNTPMHVVSSTGYIEMMRLLYEHGAVITAVNEDEETPLHRAAVAGQTSAVRQLIEWDRRLILQKDDMGNSALHLAARQGFDVTTKVLLDAGADKEARNSYQQTPLIVAVEAGRLETVQQLILKGAVVETSTEPRTLLHQAAEKGFHEITGFLLTHGAKIDRRDEKNRTALDIAIFEGHREVARTLVEAADWHLLFVPYDVLPLGRHKNVRDTPLRRVLVKFPDIAAIVLDKCVEKSSPNSHEYTYSVAYNFEMFDDTYMMPNDEGNALVGCKDAFDDEFRLLKEAKAYTDDYDIVYRNHPLKIMANAERLSLLAHPVSVALLKHKWNGLGRYVYYFALSIYILFIVFLTIYVTHTPAPYNVPFNGSIIDLTETISRDNPTCPHVKMQGPHPIFKIVVVVLATAQFIKEVFQLVQRRLSYLSWENALECFIYGSAVVTVIDFNECSANSGIKTNWQWLLAAMCTFTAWMNLLLMIRKLPRFGIYVVMFFDIVRTFSRFFVIFLLFIVAFSTSFYVIMQNRPEFSTMSSSLLKTTVMMIGEFEFTAIFHGDAALHEERMFGYVVAYPLFFFFCVVMTILLMNLLVGLAVDDIKSVQEKAELRRLIMQVDLVLQVEASMPYIRRIVTRSRYCFFPNQFGLMKRIRNRFGFDSSVETHIEDGSTSETEFATTLRTNLQLQQQQLQLLQSNVDFMFEKQVKLEAMLKCLAKGLNVDVSVEEDNA